MYEAKELDEMTDQQKTSNVGVMDRKDIPEHIREAVYIMQGVFSRLAEREEEDETEKVVWVE